MLLNLEIFKNQLLEILLQSTKVNTVAQQKNNELSLVKLPQPPAVVTQLTDPTQKMMDLFNQFFSKQKVDIKLIRAFVEISKNFPELAKPLVNFIADQQDIFKNQATLLRAVELVKDLKEIYIQQMPLQSEKVREVIAFNINTELQRISKLVQAVFLSAKEDMPAKTAQQIIDLLSFSLKTSPEHYEKDLAVLPLLLETHFDLPDYPSIKEIIDPVYLALLVINTRKRPEKAAELFYDLQQLLNEQLKPEDFVKKWQEKVPEAKVPVALDVKNNEVVLLKNSLLVSDPEIFKKHLSLPIYHTPNGFVDTQQLEFWLEQYQKSIWPSMVFLGLLPKGLHEITLRERQSKKSIFKFLFQMNSDPVDVEPDNPSPPSEISFPTNSFMAPWGGQLDFMLDPPLLFKHPLLATKPPKTPWNIKFRFLTDYVDERYQLSNKYFLSFGESPEVKKLRDAIFLLNQEGIHHYQEFVGAVDLYLDKMANLLPDAKNLFSKTKRYLREDVLLLLMGKPVKRKEYGVKQAKSGDIIASVYATSAGVSACMGQAGESMIQLCDAVKFANHKSYFLSLLKDFFKVLKGSVQNLDREQALRSLWESSLPLLPPEANQVEDKAQDYLLEEYLVENIHVVDKE